MAITPAGGGIHTGGAALFLVDEKASGTAGGTFTSGAWQTRDLNLKKFDTIGSTLAGNQFTLPAGVYDIIAQAPSFRVARHQAKLRNVTDGIDEVIGGSEFGNVAASGSTSKSFVVGRFEIDGPKTFEIQHRCASTFAAAGFGLEANFGVPETYTQVLIRRA
jgi:hypothetical protein